MATLHFKNFQGRILGFLAFSIGVVLLGFFFVSCLAFIKSDPQFGVGVDEKGGKQTHSCVDTLTAKLDPLTSDVSRIIREKCSGCHGALGNPLAPGLKMSTFLEFYSSTVGRASSADTSKLLITAFDTSKSYVYHKISQAKPAVGQQMPPGNLPKLSESELAIVSKWILLGAKKSDQNLPLGYTSPCTECTSEEAKWGNSRCHPCNQPNAPSYCVVKSFFADSIIPIFNNYCSGCHGRETSIPSGNLVLSTLDFERGIDTVPEVRNRINYIYTALVAAGKNSTHPKDPVFRVAPSSLEKSLLYQALNYPEGSSAKDSILGRMPANGQIVPDSLIGKVRRWIQSGAPGP